MSDLPPLPAPRVLAQITNATYIGEYTLADCYTAEQVRDYARSAVAAHRKVMRLALEALEAGDNAWALMNVEGIKQALRAALGERDE